MTCPSCGRPNEPGSKFCNACGSRLALACATCGTANTPGAVFCKECGAAISPGAAVAAPLVIRPAPVAPVAERRLVSILFADLVGSTALAEGRDPEETRELLNRYFDLARDVIDRYGGTVEKFIGDAVMAVWGAPTAHEDDAERAVRAGLELVDAIKTLGPTIQARAGVLTGEAAVTLGATNQGMVAGDLVNTASRLQSVAPPGAVLVGEATQRAASGAIAFEAAGEQLLKGRAAPVAAWRAVRVVAQVGGRNRAETLEAPFVGRDDELRLLKDLFHATSRERRARLVSVLGPAGIGKTRLAWEFLKYLDGLVETVWYHDGRSPAYGEGITFWALGEMVRGRAGLLETDDESTTRAKIAATLVEHVPDPDERHWIEPALLALLGLQSGVPTDHLFGAWRTFFERLAATAPVVLVFEDSHYADSGLLDFIDHLMEWSRDVPIYVMTLSRPELLEHRPTWGAGKRNFVNLSLEPLGEPAMRLLLEGLVPGLPPGAVTAIVARADGIPLYAIETVRMLLADDRLRLRDGVAHPVGDLTSLAVPETLTALIGSRLDALSTEDRAVVADAAVLGQSFTLAALVAVSGRDGPALEPGLRSLVQHEILVQRADSRSPERGQYAFVQGLIREVAYNKLARSDRKARHLAAARFFESLFDDQLAGALASHYLAAYRNASAGPEADALSIQARLALVAAGERAVSLGAPMQALRFLRDALEVSGDPADRVSLLERSGAAATAAAQGEEAEGFWSQAIELHRAAGDRTKTALAYAGLADAMQSAFRYEAALAILEPAAVEFADLGADPGLAAVLGQLARYKMLVGADPDGAMAAADRALVIAELLDLVPLVADTMVTRGSLLGRAGRRYEAVSDMEGGLRLATQHDLARTEVRARINLGGPLMEQAPKAALESARAGIELARRMGYAGPLTLLVHNAALAAWESGEWDWGVAELRRALDEGTSLELRQNLLQTLVLFMADRGEDIDAAADEIEAFLVPGIADRPHLEGQLLELRAVRLRSHDLAGAARHELEGARVDPTQARGYLKEAVFLALLARDGDLARKVLAGFDATTAVGGIDRVCHAVAAAGSALLAGDLETGRTGLARAYADFGDLGSVLRQTWTGAVLAVLLEPTDPVAAPIIDESRRTFQRLRAAWWLELLDRAIDTSGPQPVPRSQRADAAEQVLER